MSSVNLMAREVAAKIVFYGPGLSGKTTSLRKVYETVRPAHRGEMMSIATEGDRTLFFDFLPIKVEKVGDCSVRLALYTVPGQVFYNATRKLVLQGADGVVFVADSQPEAMDANRESLANLEENLLEQGIRLERFPLVIQYNKRDLDKALPVEAMRAELNPRGAGTMRLARRSRMTSRVMALSASNTPWPSVAHVSKSGAPRVFSSERICSTGSALGTSRLL